ncbi:MAG TPA: SdrD B-like domain-containing protein, partial [Phormidium sp.]
GGGIFVGEGNTLNLTNSTISDNEASIGGGIGNSGVLNLINSTVSGNTAFYGGGIHNTGTINLINSTISGNTADFSGGGIHNDFINNDNIGTATLTNVTIANNSATIGAGLINEKNATFSLANTIVANNNGTNTDLDGNFTDLGNNLIDKSNGNGFTNGVNGSIVGTNDAPIDAKIGILANNGGTTLTHALLINSLAINQGNNALISEEIPKDQRNLQRIIGNKVDIGAVEFVGYSISGKNFEDINNNGELDPNENGLENWTIYADVNNNSILDAGELFTIADAEGNYTLFVEPGTYNIQKLQETGWKQTTPNPNNPNLINITDADVKNINFGNFKLGQVRGKIFNDLNPNGILDQGETGIKDWQIFLDSNDNGLLDETEQSTTTDDNGDYSFTDLIAGIYKVRTVQQNGWKQTSNNPEDVNIISGSNVTEVNFGNFNQPLPEIEVSHQANDVPDNTETFDFGSAIVGSNISQVFTIKNSGNGDLNLSNLSLPTGFKVVGNLPEIITAGKSAELEIQLDTSQAGDFSGTLQFDTNDTDENPYNFTITGAVKAIAVSLTPGTNPSETGVTNGSFNVQLS